MVKGFIGTSLIDYPGVISGVLFFGGCNFRCPFCHNVDLVLPERLRNLKDLTEDECIEKIVKRTKFIDGVVVTGGEPTIYENLPIFLRKIKKLTPNIKIKLDTNGSSPGLLSKILFENLVDYVAVDVKSSPEKYDYATSVNDSFSNVRETINLILSNKSSIEYEFRTTVVPKIVDRDDILEIANIIKGCKKYALQQFKNDETIDPTFKDISPYQVSFIESMAEELKKNYGLNVVTRIY